MSLMVAHVCPIANLHKFVLFCFISENKDIKKKPKLYVYHTV